MIRKTTFAFTAATLLASTSTFGGWSQQIDLDAYSHGDIVSGLTIGGATIGGDNFHNSADHVVIFNTAMRQTSDPDLEGPNGNNGRWAKGNLKQSRETLGNILILQEIDRGFSGYTDKSKTAVVRPDDEGRRRGGTNPGAGEITLGFDRDVMSIGFTLIDVEETGEFNKETGFFAVFSDGSKTTKVSFADLIDSNSIYYDASIKFGDNSANRIEALTAAELGLEKIQTATINFGGSGGVGEFTVTGVPSPTAAVAGFALMGVLLGRRGNRKRTSIEA